MQGREHIKDKLLLYHKKTDLDTHFFNFQTSVTPLLIHFNT